jgi:hypothetical protein
MRRKQILSTDSEAGLKSSEMSAEFTGGYQQVQPFLKPRRLQSRCQKAATAVVKSTSDGKWG